MNEAGRERRLLRTHLALLGLGSLGCLGLLGGPSAGAFAFMGLLGWVYLLATFWTVRIGMDLAPAPPEVEAPLEEGAEADDPGAQAEDRKAFRKLPSLNAKPHRWLALVLYFGKLGLLLVALRGMMLRYPSLEGPLLGGTLLHVLTLFVEAVRRSTEHPS